MSNNSKQHELKSMNLGVYSLITCLFASASNADVPNVVTDIAHGTLIFRLNYNFNCHSCYIITYQVVFFWGMCRGQSSV